MEQYADEQGIPFETCGKLIVALDDSELGRLEEPPRARPANGVPGLREVGPEELREIEPHAAGIAALARPGTGIIDFARVATVAGRRAGRATACEILLGHEVTGVVTAGDGDSVATTDAARCAARAPDHLRRAALRPGGRADRRLADVRDRAVPRRLLHAEARGPDLCRGLIYPVPDPRFPFLGVHFTKRRSTARSGRARTPCCACPRGVPAQRTSTSATSSRR